MALRRQHSPRVRRGFSFRTKQRRKTGLFTDSQFSIEPLEPRQMLAANSLFAPLADGASTAGSFSTFAVSGNTATANVSAAPAQQQQVLATDSLLAQSPFPNSQTFTLHSLQGAPNVIYLDFVGYTSRNNTWNAKSGLPNIVSPSFSLDTDNSTFSDDEQTVIQSVWERVSEDFRPFNVDVTTQDPGANFHGIRVVIGDTIATWAGPLLGTAEDHLADPGSFGSNNPAFVFSVDLAAGMAPIDVSIAESTSHVVGITLNLDTMTGGKPSGQKGYYTIDPDPKNMGQFILTDHHYFQGYGTGETSWAPIMGEEGGMYDKELTQWSQGEYFQSDNTDDELSELAAGLGGYRTDDHGSTKATADTLTIDPATADLDVSNVADEGIIEQNTDIDYFSFTVDGLGGVVNLTINPFENGPNLDILAKIVKSSGTLVASSNPIDGLAAGSDTLGATPDGGWLLANGTYTDDLILAPGTYYLSVQGTGKPAGAPNVDPTLADSGYSNYGSLGYYSISGTIGKNLVVGVDFDKAGGASPTNWNFYPGGDHQTTLTNLIEESGALSTYQLSVSTSATTIQTAPSADPIDSSDLPNHAVPLDDLDGYITGSSNETLTFQWSNLAPSTVYQVYVFGSADVDAVNHVTVTGGQWNGVQQTYMFTQTITPDSLVVNDNTPGSNDLSTYSLLVISDTTGNITITVTSDPGSESAIAGLAISTTKVGSISGEKWNDVNGNGILDSGEAALPGWTIYLDQNNNGVLDKTSTADQSFTQFSPDIPQSILDNTTIKSELDIAQVGTILDVDLVINITHTFDADLHVFLISPAGTRVEMFANIGGSGDNFYGTHFDDDATTNISAGSAPFTGTFKPTEPLSTFNGQSATGAWKLEVSDDSPRDEGVLNSWSLTFKLAGVTTYLEPFMVTDSNGDYSFTNLPAGLYHVREAETDDQIAAGWRPSWTPNPVTVRSAAMLQNVNFGNWIPIVTSGSIQGQKFNDLNGDGIKEANEPGLAGWTVYVDSNNNGVRDTGATSTVAASDLPKPITDFNTTTSKVSVTSLGSVTGVEVTLDITHSFVGDLDAYLVSPTGTQIALFTGVGGQYNDFHNLTLDDSAARSITTIGVNDLPYTGHYQPQSPLSGLVGEDAQGTWSLVVTDTAFADEGTLNSWSLTITTGELSRVTDDDGNYNFANLPAGQYVVREEAQAGWTQIPPATKTIPGAVWAAGQWTAAVVGVDNPSDPNGPDSQRNIKNVNFGNQSATPLPGDYDHSGVVDAADYVMWRMTLGQGVSAFSGADGNGNGVIDAGDYQVWRTNFNHYLDDYGNNAATAASVSTLPSTLHGVIEVAGDVDWFKFTAVAGKTYDLSTTLGSLTDTKLRVIDTDGTTQLDQNDNSVGLASLIHFTAQADGTYYVEVSGNGALRGSYDFSIAQSTVFVDDYGNDAAGAAAIAIPSTTSGNIEVNGDVDWFKFSATMGTEYQFATTLLTLSDSVLWLYDQDGTTQLALDDDGGPGHASLLNWTAPGTGTYYVEVSGFSSSTGTYTLAASITLPGAGTSLGEGAMALDSMSAPTNPASSGLFLLSSSDSTANGSSPTGKSLATGTAVNGAPNDDALIAWAESLANTKAGGMTNDEGGNKSDVHSDADTDDFFGSVDSIFDRLGADAFAVGSAV